MARVYVVTAGSGDIYCVERIYLDRGQADRFAQDYKKGWELFWQTITQVRADLAGVSQK
jgi:hypothetical protein